MIPPEERVLDRIPEFDERSRSFPIRPLLATVTKPRSYTWNIPNPGFPLDQGREGACVGFAWTHELAARPVVLSVSQHTARALYHEAQKVDEWPGEDYEGTSVLAAAKVLTEQGRIREYRWAFGLEDLKLAVGYKGPAVIGVYWYQGMDDVDDEGFIHATGMIRGGHAIMVNSVSLRRGAFGVLNSWGPGWGQNGRAWISFEDMDKLLHEDGEAAIPVRRS
jgi:hypothetical protein